MIKGSSSKALSVKDYEMKTIQISIWNTFQALLDVPPLAYTQASQTPSASCKKKTKEKTLENSTENSNSYFNKPFTQ